MTVKFSWTERDGDDGDDDGDDDDDDEDEDEDDDEDSPILSGNLP